MTPRPRPAELAVLDQEYEAWAGLARDSEDLIVLALSPDRPVRYPPFGPANAHPEVTAVVRPEQLTEEFVYGLAPDGKAAQAGRELALGGAFPEPRISPDRTCVFASCRGSGPLPYEVVVDLADPGRPAGRCTCPSRKYPCKHVLGLMLLAGRDPARFREADPPEALRAEREEQAAAAATAPRRQRPPKEEAPADLEEALREAVLAEPTEEAPRLVYADWLQERGDADGMARGEFIQVQCRLERLPPRDPDRAALERRERELWSRYRRQWLGGVPVSLHRKDLAFRRGFLEEVRLSARMLRNYAPTLFRSHPVHRVRLRGGLTMEEAGKLAVFQPLARLTALSLRANELRDAKALAVLLATPFLSRLAELDLAENRLGWRGAQALAALPQAERLRTLDLSANVLGLAGARALAGSPHLAHLTRLVLEDNALGDDGARALADSPHLAGLAALELGENGIGPRGAKALADSPHLAGLTCLGLAGNPVGGRAPALLKRFGDRVRLG